MKILITTSILIILLLSTLGLAVPTVPNVFSGTISYEDNPGMSLVGFTISATVGSFDLGKLGEVKAGNSYKVLVDPQGHSGIITFYIGDVEASPTASYEMGAFTTLNLNVDEVPTETICGNNNKEIGEQCDGTDLNFATCSNVVQSGWVGNISCNSDCTFDITQCSAPQPYCGDGSCNNDETCSSCSQDCGTCSTGSTGGGGGGGGSSSSSSTTTTPSGSSSPTSSTPRTSTPSTSDSFSASSNEDVAVTSEENTPATESSGDLLTGATAAEAASGKNSELWVIGILAGVLILLSIGYFTLFRKKK